MPRLLSPSPSSRSFVSSFDPLADYFVNYFSFYKKKSPHALFECKALANLLDPGLGERLGEKKSLDRGSISEPLFHAVPPHHTLPRANSAIRGDATQPIIRSIFYITPIKGN